MQSALYASGSVTFSASHLRWEPGMCVCEYAAVGAHAPFSDMTLIMILFSGTPPGGAVSSLCLSFELPLKLAIFPPPHC